MADHDFIAKTTGIPLTAASACVRWNNLLGVDRLREDEWARAYSFMDNHEFGPGGWQWKDGGEAAHRAKFPDPT